MEIQDKGIQLILGPMFSGKTQELLLCGDRYMVADRNILFIRKKNFDRPNIDGVNCIASRTNGSATFPCVEVDDIMTEVTNDYDVYLIDEGHFMKDIAEFCKRVYRDWGKLVIVAALNGTWEQRPFKHDYIAQLLPLVTDLRLLHAVCIDCKTQAAPYSYNINRPNSDEDKGSDQYKALCMSCLKTYQ